MGKSWKLITAAGIGIYVHWTFLLLPVWVFFFNLRMSNVELALFSVGMVLAIFVCVVLHELGHALMARHFGIPTRDITLYPIGGVARMERMSEKPWEELCISIAGPAVNVAIALFLGMALFLGDAPMSTALPPKTIQGALFLVMFANLFLALFNMLPAFPMDGGRVLRALLAIPLGRLRATQVAVTLGIIMAAGFCVLGYYNPMLILMAVVIVVTGRQELAILKQQDMQAYSEPLDVISVPQPAAPWESFSGVAWDQRSGLWILWSNGTPIRAFPLKTK